MLTTKWSVAGVSEVNLRYHHVQGDPPLFELKCSNRMVQYSPTFKRIIAIFSQEENSFPALSTIIKGFLKR